MSNVPRLVVDDRINAALTWTGVAALLAFGAIALARREAFQALLALIVATVAAVPAVVRRDPELAPPWELLVIALAPIVVRAMDYGARVTVYLTVATVALLLAVELHTLTEVEMTPRFAAVFVVVTTMATAGAVGIAAYAIEVTTGTNLLAGRIAFMWDLVAATAIGIVAAAAFALYVQQTGSLSGGDRA